MAVGEKKKSGKKGTEADKEVSLKTKASAIVAATGRQRNGKPETVQKQVLITHDMIAKRAFAIWQSLGKPAGRDKENWLEAERQLKAEAKV